MSELNGRRIDPQWTPETLVEALLELHPGDVRGRESMSKHTPLGVGGPADAWVAPEDRDALRRVLRYLRDARVPWLVIGAGTCLLIREGGVTGVVLSLEHFSELRSVEGEAPRIFAGAGARLEALGALSVEVGRRSFEMFGGAQGTVGGAVLLNAGSPPMAEMVDDLEVMSGAGREQTLRGDALKVSSHRIELPKGRVLLGATLRPGGDVMDAVAHVEEEEIEETPPPTTAWIGPLFRNPPPQKRRSLSAVALIQECRLPGVRVHGARICEENGNYILNVDDANATDVQTLMRLIRETVREKQGVVLESNIRVVGRAVGEQTPLSDMA